MVKKRLLRLSRRRRRVRHLGGARGRRWRRHRREFGDRHRRTRGRRRQRCQRRRRDELRWIWVGTRWCLGRLGYQELRLLRLLGNRDRLRRRGGAVYRLLGRGRRRYRKVRVLHCTRLALELGIMDGR